MSRGPHSFRVTSMPTANQIIALVDSTTNISEYATWAAAAPAVGYLRSHPAYLGKRLTGVMRWNQAVTVTFQRLHAGAFMTDAEAPDAGSKALAADTDYHWSFLPQGTEYRILITAGATPPTTGEAQAVLVCDRDPGA